MSNAPKVFLTGAGKLNDALPAEIQADLPLRRAWMLVPEEPAE